MLGMQFRKDSQGSLTGKTFLQGRLEGREEQAIAGGRVFRQRK